MRRIAYIGIIVVLSMLAVAISTNATITFEWGSQGAIITDNWITKFQVYATPSDFASGDNATNVTIRIREPPLGHFEKYKEYSALPNLSWVKVEPQYRYLHEDEKGSFDITIAIPECNENRNRHWMVEIHAINMGTKNVSGVEMGEGAGVALLIDTERTVKAPMALNIPSYLIPIVGIGVGLPVSVLLMRKYRPERYKKSKAFWKEVMQGLINQ